MAAYGQIGSGQNAIIKEKEIKKPVFLCDSQGCLNSSAIGWSRFPIHDCNITGHNSRKKKWNYWLIISDKNLFSITIADMDYAGIIFSYFYDFETKKFIEKTVTLPPPMACSMPDNPGESISYNSKSIHASFFEDKDCTKIHVEIPDFDGITLRAEFFVDKPKEHESLNVVIPWSKNKFQFTSKQNCLPAVGTVELGTETFFFKEGTMASLDFGRGVWPRNSFWNWATCSGRSNDRVVGINLGGGWTDNTGMTENAVFVDGEISKISDKVIFKYDINNLMSPWTLKTENTERVDLKFTPVYERLSKTNAVFVKSNMYQMFGHFSGIIVTDEGEKIEVKDIFGCAEEHTAKW